MGRKDIQDEFTHLPVSRQRKLQMRWKRDGKCIICGKELFSAFHCKKHWKDNNDRSRSSKGCKTHKSWSKFKDGVKRQTQSQRCYELRMSGVSFREIAKAFGISVSTATTCASYWARTRNLPLGKQE